MVDASDKRHTMHWFGEALAYVSSQEAEISHFRHSALALFRRAGMSSWDRARVEEIKRLDKMKHLQRG